MPLRGSLPHVAHGEVQCFSRIILWKIEKFGYLPRVILNSCDSLWFFWPLRSLFENDLSVISRVWFEQYLWHLCLHLHLCVCVPSVGITVSLTRGILPRR